MNEEIREINNLLAILKVIWWIILVVSGFLFLYQRYASIGNLSTSIDIIILLFWISLLLMPFFQEISFYGLKLKKEIDTLRSDINKQFVNLRSDIKNSIDLNTQQTNNVIMQSPPDSLLPKIGEMFRQTLEEKLSSQGIQKPVSTSELTETPDNIQYLFSVRYQIEKELRRIWKESSIEDNKYPVPIYKMVRYITSIGLIDPKLENIITQVYRITSPAIHGEEVSEDKVHFVQSIAPELIISLQGI